jgi:hypothetical protein
MLSIENWGFFSSSICNSVSATFIGGDTRAVQFLLSGDFHYVWRETPTKAQTRNRYEISPSPGKSCTKRYVERILNTRHWRVYLMVELAQLSTTVHTCPHALASNPRFAIHVTLTFALALSSLFILLYPRLSISYGDVTD